MQAPFVSFSLALSASLFLSVREISETGKLMREQGCNYTARVAELISHG